MTEAVVNAVLERLGAAGISALRQYPDKKSPLGNGCIYVSPEVCSCVSVGMGEYLGTKTAPDGRIIELFGRRLEFELGAEIYVPFSVSNAAEVCLHLGNAMAQALPSSMPALRFSEIRLGAVEPKQELEAFCSACRLKGTALFSAEADEGRAEFLNFTFKGTVDVCK